MPSTSLNKSLVLISEELSDRLAADIDFQKFSTGVHDLIVKVKETNSGQLFLEYLHRTISNENKAILLSNLGYFSEESFLSFFIDNNNHKEAVQRKFPELKKFEITKSDIENAVIKVFRNRNKLLHTDLDCLAAYAALLNACLNGCYLYANDVSLCIEECWLSVSAFYFSCILTAD